ncbi:MAG TPA: lycopene cyclase domain-containing protein [Actinomycetes bacterium]|nr:lycopene cyclase domain-containing protein [Actinomycetes bacterium]
MTYTALSLTAVGFALVLDLVLLRTRLVRRRVFWVSYAIVLAGQLVTNGVLAGTRIVRYDAATITGLRVAWAPVEDLGFGFSLILQTLAWWVFWGRRSARRAPADVRPAGDGQPSP